MSVKLMFALIVILSVQSKLGFLFIFSTIFLRLCHNLAWKWRCWVQNHCSQLTRGITQFNGASWCWKSSIKVTMPHLLGHSAPAWLVLHILWSQNRAGPSVLLHISGQDQDLQEEESALWNQANRGFYSTKTSVNPAITCALYRDVKRWLPLLGGRRFALWIPNGQTAEPSETKIKPRFKD